MPWPARIEGAAFEDRASSLAGLLAERGVQSIVIRQAGREVRHHARVTDLPATLVKQCPCDVQFIDPAGHAELRCRVAVDSITLESAQDRPAS